MSTHWQVANAAEAIAAQFTRMGSLFPTMLCWPWLDLVKTAAPVATAVIAFLALKNWKRQENSKRRADFLDQLLAATHTYIAEMGRRITLVDLINISMAANVPGNGTLVQGAIAYIGKQGKDDAKKLMEALEEVQPSVILLRSLSAKGQVFSFNDYARCQNAIIQLTWHFDRVEALMACIASSTCNWENPEAVALLKR